MLVTMRILSLLGLLLLASPLSAQKSSAFNGEFWPGAQYDSSIPTFSSVLGYKAGEHIAPVSDITRYFEALAAARPTRIKVFDYAQSWERRRLIYAVTGSEENIRRLDEIKAGMQKLADPRKTNEAEAKRLMASLPAVILLTYNVHGNELSGPEAAMLTAWHLLAAKGDAMVDRINKDVLTLIIPTQNPDGRDRFVNQFLQARGLEPDAFPAAAEHAEPWPGGRYNHYLFDMNRDWFAMTQPEIRGQIKVQLQYYPLAVADLHEMSGESTYYFTPGAVPWSPHLEKKQRETHEWFGRNNAKWFDQFGFRYFTREVFDEFYPGYGASWPAYYGATAMTYENAAVRGLLYERADGVTITFAESVQKHFLASISTCDTAQQRREALLAQFWNYRKTAIEEGKTEGPKEFVLIRQGDVTLTDRLANLLLQQGIEIRRSTAAFTANGKTIPAGSYLISTAQPSKRLIRVLLDPRVEMEDFFIKEQERRRKKKLRDEIYDVTAWNLPMLYNVDSMSLSTASSVNSELLTPSTIPAGGVTSPTPPTIAYLVPWGSAAAGRFLSQSLRAGHKVLSSNKAFKQNGRSYPAGSLILRVRDNADNFHEAVRNLALKSRAEVIPTNESWMEEGPDFGSNNVVTLRAPKIAMAWDAPTQAMSAGHTRFTLEQEFGYPVTAIRTRTLGFADLSKFHVLIFPDGSNYASELGAGGIRRLKDWVSAGGVVIGINGGTAMLADSRVGLLPTQTENTPRDGKPSDAKPTDGPAPGKVIATEEEYQKAIQAEKEMPDDVAGVLVRAKVDNETWIGAGAPASVHVLVSGRSIYSPLRTDKGVNAAIYEAPDKLLASGYLWEENRKQLAFKPFVMVAGEGRGQVVAFTADPNFRGYMEGLNILFINAVFRGPAQR
jgi:hypothetical protein